MYILLLSRAGGQPIFILVEFNDIVLLVTKKVIPSFDLDIPLDNFYFSLFTDRPITNSTTLLDPSMFLHLISSDNRGSTTSSRLIMVDLLHVATTILSHEFGKKYNRLVHVSSSIIMIYTLNS